MPADHLLFQLLLTLSASLLLLNHAVVSFVLPLVQLGIGCLLLDRSLSIDIESNQLLHSVIVNAKLDVVALLIGLVLYYSCIRRDAFTESKMAASGVGGGMRDLLMMKEKVGRASRG